MSRYVLIFLAVAVVLPFSGDAEPRGSVPASQADAQFQRDRSQDPFATQMERDRQKKLNKARQESLKKDTDKLLQLATELKTYVDKSNENTLSLEVVRKAEQIEKLAHSVKEKMKGD